MEQKNRRKITEITGVIADGRINKIAIQYKKREKMVQMETGQGAIAYQRLAEV